MSLSAERVRELRAKCAAAADDDWAGLILTCRELLALLDALPPAELSSLTEAMRDSTVKPGRECGNYVMLIDFGTDKQKAAIAYRILGAMALSGPLTPPGESK